VGLWIGIGAVYEALLRRGFAGFAGLFARNAPSSHGTDHFSSDAFARAEVFVRPIFAPRPRRVSELSNIPAPSPRIYDRLVRVGEIPGSYLFWITLSATFIAHE